MTRCEHVVFYFRIDATLSNALNIPKELCEVQYCSVEHRFFHVLGKKQQFEIDIESIYLAKRLKGFQKYVTAEVTVQASLFFWFIPKVDWWAVKFVSRFQIYLIASPAFAD